jgi:eukaryotic-like serine/threonine-protein kinase
MSVPATIDVFLDLVRKSGMVEESRLNDYLGQLTDPPPATKVTRLARRMVQDGVLTRFQAEQLVQGRWKGFAIGNYRIIERIAQGGMGTVYLAEHKFIPRQAAVKVLPSELARSQLVLERFYREARSAAALDHPNLVRATDVDCENGVHYLVMDYIEGVNLQDLVDRRGPLPAERAANYIGQAACGLEHAHTVAGMVHRDIKPANLMLDRSGTVKLLDLGLARMKMVGFFNAQTDDITKNHNDQSVLGTADYVAPEQALDSQAADVRADMYSLGGTFYFLLTGEPPFPGGSLTQKLMAHQLQTPRGVRTLRPEVPESLAELIGRMLAKDPAVRPQSPAEVVEALTPWLKLSLPPPSEAEIPPLCAAVQGPRTGGSGMLLVGPPLAPQSSTHRSGRPSRSVLDTPPPPVETLPVSSTPAPVPPKVMETASRAPVPAAPVLAPEEFPDLPVPPFPRSESARLARGVWLALAVSAAFIVGAGLAWWMLQPRGTPATEQRSSEVLARPGTR